MPSQEGTNNARMRVGCGVMLSRFFLQPILVTLATLEEGAEKVEERKRLQPEVLGKN
jgi:hypothetical protein